MIMIDRIIILSKSVRFNTTGAHTTGARRLTNGTEIKIKAFNIFEPLIMGYLG